MAKLNAAVNEIQLTTNMINSQSAAADWDTDAKYPSAKAVAQAITTATSAITCNVEYPIGSVIMVHKELSAGETYEATNPAATFGGTWTLVDKAFKNGTSTIGGPNVQFSPTANNFNLSLETAIRNDHTLLLQLGVSVGSTTSVPSGQSNLTMANLTLARYGVYGLSHNPTNGIAFATHASNASSVINYWISGNGELSLRDVVTGGSSTHALNTGSYIYINVAIPIPHGDMIDSFCDKFYWKRTA